MLDETGLDYTLHPVNLLEGANKSEEYLALNPMGLIPIIDPDGPDGKPMTLTQSMTILTYLATKTGKFMLIIWRRI